MGRKTALTAFERLEGIGLWRPDPETQRREVVVSLGEATLVILGRDERPLAHWSVAAVTRANPGRMPAIYHPDSDPGETLELGEDAAEMIEAIEQIRQAIERRRPRPGHLRRWLMLASILLVAAGLWLWAPGALRQHALGAVPEAKRMEIGTALLGRLERLAGPPCNRPEGVAALRRLALRALGPEAAWRVVVLRDGLPETAHLPGGIIVVNRKVVEDHEDPAAAAGFLIAEGLRRELADPLGRVLDDVGIWGTITLLTTGEIPGSLLDTHAEALLATPPPRPPTETLIARFRATGIPSRPYAYALDPTGETVRELIANDPMAGRSAPPVIPDGDWIRLQAICEF